MIETPYVLKVVFYRTEAGNEPVREWLKGLPREDKHRIGEDIKTAQLGWPLGMPLIKKIEKDLWEVRTMLESGIARVYDYLDANVPKLLRMHKKRLRGFRDIGYTAD